ncbi:uncharacterized protein LOC132950311 [Metopolophium dirhodum]|uniref:uncharacterized protein LOC132950311 n=1 Tax=Metopolophium dirhodum TaxID=44670 RepID=UPI00299071C7|nr:uncharacterized protein LOC132950311 [Metopolophium dirhodum]
MAYLQINLNRSREAQALALHTMEVKGANVLCISEPNCIPDHPGWVGSTDGKCALFFQQNQHVLRTGSGAGYAWADLDDLRIYSCYISPKCTLNEFDVFLYRLFDSVRGATSEVIVSGDFNAHSPAWGSHKTNPRGKALIEIVESLNLLVLNDGKVPTFPHVNSFLDLTLVAKGITRKIGSWEVLEQESLTDHQYVFFNTRMTLRSVQTEKNGWSWRKLDIDRLDKFIAEAKTPLSMTAETSSTALSELLRNACNSCMPKGTYKWGEKPCYWWSQTIAELRKECMHSRRKLRKSRTRNEDCVSKLEEYKVLKRKLKAEIRKSKENS